MNDDRNTSPAMTIGVIGAGAIGAAFARGAARSGSVIVLSNSRSPATLASLAASMGPRVSAGTRDEAAAQDLVLVAVPWSKLPTALAGLPDFGGRVVMDANNALEPPHFRAAELGGRLSTEVFADLVPSARVVKAFNHLRPELLEASPTLEGGRRVLFYSGNDPVANSHVGALMKLMGFAGVDLGPLAIGGRLMQFPGGSLPTRTFAEFG